MLNKKPLQALSLVISLGSLSAEASLVSRAGGTMIYDTVQDITWVADASLFRTLANASGNSANYVQGIISSNEGIITSGNGTHLLAQSDFNAASGRMNWYAAKAWVNTLNYGGIDQWRLPSMIDVGNDGCGPSSDCSYNIDTSLSEAGYMYFENLGLKPWRDIDGNTPGNHGIFGDGSTSDENNIGLVINLQSAAWWMNNENVAKPDQAWYFNDKWGSQGAFSKTYMEYVAWAVADGDVAPVPIPAAVWLFGTGLIGLQGLKRRTAKA